MQIKENDHHSTMSLLFRFKRRGLKLTDAIFVRRLSISKRIVPKDKLGSKRKVNIMLIYVSKQIWLKFLTMLGCSILNVQLMFLI